MAFIQIGSGLSASADASAAWQGPNAFPIGLTGNPRLRTVTFAVAGEGDGASMYLVLGANASATASSPWFVLGSSTMDMTADPFSSVANFNVPSGSFLGLVLNSVSASTSLDVWIADSYT